MNKYIDIITEIRKIFKTDDSIALHTPFFDEAEKENLINCMDSTFVSTVGQYVNDFEKHILNYTGSKYAIAFVNGTSALHIALELVGVEKNTEVITQPLTFVATCNSIKYRSADPIFIDIDFDTMGMSPSSLLTFLSKNVVMKEKKPINRRTKKRISACVPMHTFGQSCRIKEIVEICHQWNIPVVEDAAEALGSRFNDQHLGTFGDIGVLSFNGNKIITTGGGGMLITNNDQFGKKAKHLSTTAKVPHPWNYFHDVLGYNYRLPNINAAIGCAQMNKFNFILERKRELSERYIRIFERIENVDFIKEIENSKSNYWLNTIKFKNKDERDAFLKKSNDSGVMTRPAWTLMYKLPMYFDCFYEEMTNSELLADTIVNIPSSINYKR